MNYKIIDPLIGFFSGAIVASTAAWLASPDWDMFPAMLAGGVCGMILQLFLTLLLMPFFGAFEVMIPLAIIGMLAGMGGGMAATLADVSRLFITATGGALGLAVTAWVCYSHRSLTQAD